MKDSGPYPRPSHELWVNRYVVDLENIVDGEVEQGDKTCHANYGKRLGAHGAENDGG
jgi:hypothetical protein